MDYTWLHLARPNMSRRGLGIQLMCDKYACGMRRWILDEGKYALV